MTLVGVGLLIVGGLTIWRMTRSCGCSAGGGSMIRGRERFRAVAGALRAGRGSCLVCALLLAGGQFVFGNPRVPLPDLQC